MTIKLSIAEITARFPEARIAVARVERLTIVAARPPALQALIAEREAVCRARWGAVELSAIPGVAAWRTAYRGFGVKKTSYRSSVERLMKRVLAGEALPLINSFVDIYNVVSLTHVFCCGADDLDKVAPPLAFRFARDGDSFLDMGAAAGEDPNDPPKTGEVVYADAEKVLCRRWNWRQDARSAISPETRRGVVTLQANGPGELEAAVADFHQLVAAFCGGLVTTGMANAAAPEIEV